MPYSLKVTLKELESVRPLSSIKILKRISQIDWTDVRDADLDSSVDIILRITADLITLINSKDEKNFEIYVAEFQKIGDRIESSKITKRSVEFCKYYSKYRDYLNQVV